MNPKLAGSNIIDCIPQIGECPNKCGQEIGEDCFYNGGRFYRTLDEPLLPSRVEAEDKIVRVNSGHDSNLQREYVITETLKYKNKFYNTSMPRFVFPAPVVFTCNARSLLLVEPANNVMFVRVRTSMWNLEDVDKAVDWYLKKYGIPIVLTFMRYYKESSIKEEFRSYYTEKKHVLNTYFCLNTEGHLKVMERYKGTGVRMCGTPVSSLCIDCRNCEFLYWKCMNHLNEGGFFPLKEKT